MLRHIVLMRLEADTEEQRLARSAQLSGALAALPDLIPQIRSLTVDANVLSGRGNWDLALTVDVDDEAGLEVYREHPEHWKVLALIAEIVADRSAVDVFVQGVADRHRAR